MGSPSREAAETPAFGTEQESGQALLLIVRGGRLAGVGADGRNQRQEERTSVMRIGRCGPGDLLLSGTTVGLDAVVTAVEPRR